jgi:GAF domain-containing protein
MSQILHPQEAERLAALHRQRILDTGADPRFDRLVLMAAQLLSVPIAVVSFVDADRIWIKAKIGIEERELDRDESPCGVAILQTSPLVIEDAVNDATFRGGLYVAGPPFVRFYAGVNIYSEERLPIGVFSIADPKPRRIDHLELQVLSAWARQAEAFLHGDALTV